MGKTFLDIGFGNDLLNITHTHTHTQTHTHRKKKPRKSKNIKVGLHLSKKFLLDKENNQQNEMITYGMGEDNCNHTYDKQSKSKIYKVFP